MIRSNSVIAIPPGETVKELLEYKGMSQKELAARIGMTEKHVSRLLSGDVQLTVDMARRLEMALGPSVEFWCRLEALYRDAIIRAEEENAMEEDLAIARKLPYKEMIRLGWLEEQAVGSERVNSLRKFFEVARLSFLQESLLPSIACRKLSDTEKSDLALLTWAQKAKLEAREIATGPVKPERIAKDIPKIRRMTILSPEEFDSQLTKLLAERGVALVFLPHMQGSFLHGATFRDGKKLVLGLTLRGKDADKFWFSLFHELGHILLGHVGKAEGLSEAEERAADVFAADSLIAPKDFESFVKKGDFGKNAIFQFADSIAIDAGIVIGRLQKEGLISYGYLNECKAKYA